MDSAIKRFYRKYVPDAFAGKISKLLKRAKRAKPSTLDYECQIVDSLKVIFVHNPKAGGTPMENILAQHCATRVLQGHTTATDYQLMWPDKWDSYFTFGFVRNPWARVISAFFYARRNLQGNSFVERHILPYGDNVDGFIREVLGENEEAIYHLVHLRPQFHFLCNCDRSIAVDFVGRLENVETDWKAVCRQLAIDDELPHVNKSNHKHYREYFTDRSVEIVADVYKDDIEIFDYRYES